MKKFLYLILLLSIAGALLSALLTVEYYYPEASGRVISCGEGLADPCYTVSQSPYSSMAGIPLAAMGLYAYLVLIFALLVADYAGGETYSRWAAALTLLLSGLSLAVDAALGALLIYMGQFCTHCVATYVINALIFIAALIWARNIPGFSLYVFKPRAEREEAGPHRRAALSLAFIAVIFLFFTVFSTTRVLKEKTYYPSPHVNEISAFLKEFYAGRPENITLPPSRLVLGPQNAPVHFIVFTDFLCSACYEFYLVEKSLFARYPGKVRVSYYHYPLDNGCNRQVRNTRYPNSCVASRAMIAAGALGNFEDYIVGHFRAYKRFYGRYDRETALELASG